VTFPLVAFPLVAFAPVTAWLPAVPLLLAGAALAVGVRRLARRGDHWPHHRTALTAAGLVALAVGLLPPLAGAAHLHVQQHLLVAMAAPVLLALGAPVTLALRAVGTPTRRRLLAVLASRPVRAVTWPPVVVALNVGGLYLVYLGPLAPLLGGGHAEHVPWLHALVHVHMIAAGCLLAWLVVSPDPMPRPGVAGRLAVVVAAGAGHDVVAKLLYARGWGADAEVMFYGGTVVDVALAVIVMAQWYAAGGRELARAARRGAAAPVAASSAEVRTAG
jgi:putative membrane protein